MPKLALLAGLATLAFAAAPAAAAPVLAGGAVSPGTWSTEPTMNVSWTQTGMEASGATDVSVQMNEAGDGTASGAWQVVWIENGAVSGARTAVFSTEGRDGKRAMRVVVRSGFQVMTTLAVGPAQIDHTAPALTRPGSLHSPSQNVFSWAEEDIHAGIDTAAHYLEVNSGGGWVPDGAWVPVPFAASGEGAQTASLPASAISPGNHAVRVRVVDRAGNEAVLALGTAFNDQTPPAVTPVRVVEAPTPTSQAVEVAYGFTDGFGGSWFDDAVPSSLTTESGATTLWEGPQHLAGGEMRIRAHLPGPRTYRLVVRVTDRAGNVGVSAPFTVVSPARGSAAAVTGPTGPDGAGSPSRPDVARPELRLRLSVVASRRRGSVAIARIVHGQTVTVRGTLTTASGRPVRREEVEVRDPSGRMLGRAVTDSAGRFRLTVSPHTGGDLRVGIPLGGGRLALPTASVTARVLVVPRVSLNVSTRNAVAGASPVVFSGRVAPGPGTLKGTARKRVVLEWMDPLRREWRPVLNGYADSAGRYRFSWRFGVPGFSIPMRVSVPSELGWPFEPALSRVVTVVVR